LQSVLLKRTALVAGALTGTVLERRSNTERTLLPPSPKWFLAGARGATLRLTAGRHKF
jgi:hypothetical protein